MFDFREEFQWSHDFKIMDRYRHAFTANDTIKCFNGATILKSWIDIMPTPDEQILSLVSMEPRF